MLLPKGLQIVVPMAGDGARFRAAGYELPKPLIPVDGVPMVVRAVADLPAAERVVLVVRRDHDHRFHVCDTLRQHLPHAEFVLIDSLTAGQACTVRLAGSLLNPDQPVLVAACDNTHVYDAGQFAAVATDETVDALIWTYRHDRRVLANPRQFGWVAAEGTLVRRISCKRPISDNVLADHVISGCFYFRSAGQLLAAIDRLVEREERVNGEFYLDCVPNVLIDAGSRVNVFEVERYIGWGTPEELADYLRSAESAALAATA